MTSDRPGRPGGEAWRLRNKVAGDVHGDAVQAGEIAGGVHFTTTNNYFGAPAANPQQRSASLPVPAVRRVRPPRRWPRVVGEWLLSFVPIFALSLVPGMISLAAADDSTFGGRLVGLVVGLVVVALIGVCWWLVTRRRSRLSPVGFALTAMDWLAFKRLGTVGVPGLIVVLVIFGGAMIAGLAQQPQVSATSGVEHPGAALVCCSLVVVVAVRRLARPV